MRLSGLASGLDVDAMVKELMKAKRSSYDTMVKKRTQIEWKREDYRTISSKIVDFRNNKLSSFNLSNTIAAKTTEVSGDTNALKVNSTTSSASGTLSVNVTDVATNARTIYQVGNGNLGAVSFTINGEQITLDAAASKGSDLAAAINANSKTKATAVFNEQTGQISISATETGGGAVTAPTSKLIITNTAGLTATSSVPGKQASITINGMTYTQDSNRFLVNGIDFTVKAQSASDTTIAVVQDTSKIIDTIKSFVKEYNDLIGLINGELSEDKNRKFLPLTSDERAALSDKEAEQWEDKARSGTLRNDSTLSKYVSDLRTIATTLINGISTGGTDRLQIGITTGSYGEKGKLVLDEDKLRKALESKPQEVTNLFADGSNGVFKNMMDASLTALTSLSKIAGTSLTSSDSKSFLESSILGDQLRGMRDKEFNVLARLNKLETQYYKQFSAMEKAINKFNSQSSSLNGLL
ncbi:flagellar filament capping protein FliD [Paenibacillus sp. NPDC058174]|uniref:flagellar filament capping protein FliD n=1 Tax=Paenibacillus sp. NPDC058174 TaxID=3346366 RepID=UPI0036DF5BC7